MFDMVQLASGDVIQDRYLVQHPLGQGGMGTAYAVLDQLWDRRVALKLLEIELLEGLRREFDLLRGLAHPHLTRVHDFARVRRGHEVLCFYTADLVEGTTLDRAARGHRWAEIRPAFCHALEALRLLHAAGIRHGDLKPANVLVDARHHGVLIDLGCARPLGSGPSPQIAGTPGYLAPELLETGTADARADLYAAGVTLQEVLAELAELPPEPVRLLARRLRSPNPADRPADTDEVLQLLGVETALIHPVVHRLGCLVGRAAELALADEAIEALLAGRAGSRALLLTGPRGIGRSRALREIKWAAQGRSRVIEANASSPVAMARLISHTLASEPTIGPLEALLRAGERLAPVATEATPPVRTPVGAEATVWIIDDVQLLDESQRALLEAALRLLDPEGPLLVVAAGISATDLTGEPLHLTVRELAPLTADQVAGWVGSAISPRALSELIRLTGGYPGAIRSMLGRLAFGAETEEAILRSTESLELSAPRRAEIRALPRSEQRALGLLAVVEGAATAEVLACFGVAGAALEELAAHGLAERDGPGWTLVRAGEREGLLDALPRSLLREIHAAVAAWYGERIEREGAAAELAARQVRHLALAGEVHGAAKLLRESERLRPGAPRAWLRAAEALADVSPAPEVRLTAAALERAAGHPRRARDRLALLLTGRPEPAIEVECHLELGACELRLGQTERAIEQLGRALELASDPRSLARAANLLTRSLTSAGRYREAVERAAEGLRVCEDPVLRADLLEAAGVALSYTEDPAGAGRRLNEAAVILDQLDDPRRQVRALGSRAVVAYAEGDLVRAGEDHRRALEIAEREGLVDQVATAALNLGTVQHQRGDWAEARTSYERGLRIAVALGQQTTEAWLRFNLAKLNSDLGLFERALDMADRAFDLARRSGPALVSAAAETVRAEVALARGEPERARELLLRASEGFQRFGSRRELAELRLQLAEAELASESFDRAGEALDRASELLRGLGAHDVELRSDLIRARLLLASGSAAAALAVAERAVERARSPSSRDLVAEAEAVLARIWETRGAAALAARHRRRARELWERTAAPLSTAVREAFWGHPRRSDLRERVEHSLEVRSRGADGPGRYARLLEINKRLNSTLETKQVLSQAMDAAIELTGAERGFVLLADEGRGDGGLRVAVARNFDREHLGRSALKFSRGIAERVVATGELLVTADAQTDERLHTKRSIHALSLRSVVCVPVASPAGILGALYLDNRFQRGLFRSDDVELLRAFADQVALALTNARLHDELRRRNRELEVERRRVEELLHDQAEEIDRLTEEVQRGRVPRDRRFDYGPIVGSSRAMAVVFDLLDRVIDTDLPILIQGESGTGKELVARAIHDNSPRSGALVSVNCGALPESLLESELFGYERGAFTGADRAREGIIAQAGGGTLFLDEVGEMPPSMQVKLLRVLQEGEVQPLGSTAVVPVDLRLVCATNRSLRHEVSEGGFREDLYYRISAVEVNLPPLRERAEDIAELVPHLLARAAEGMGRPAPELTRGAMRRLLSFEWPGNVRQLEHALTKALVLAEGDRITARDLELPEPRPRPERAQSRAEFERQEAERIAEALVENRWNVSRVSRLLGIPRPTLYRRIKKYGLTQGLVQK